MAQFRTALIITILGLAAVAGGVFYFSGESREVTASRGFSSERVKPVVLPRDRSLASYSPADLQALVGQIAGQKKEENKRFTKSAEEYVVDSGDTIVTDGYETAPGVFVFSTVKFWVTGSPAEPKVAFKLNRAKVSASGEYEALVNDEHEIGSGRGYGATNDRYALYFKATVLRDGQINVSMEESEYERSRIMVSP